MNTKVLEYYRREISTTEEILRAIRLRRDRGEVTQQEYKLIKHAYQFRLENLQNIYADLVTRTIMFCDEVN